MARYDVVTMAATAGYPTRAGWRLKSRAGGKFAEFVQWWRYNVTVRHGPGGIDRAKNADLRSLMSVENAETLTGITQQQVSRWAKGTQNPEKYRRMAGELPLPRPSPGNDLLQSGGFERNIQPAA